MKLGIALIVIGAILIGRNIIFGAPMPLDYGLPFGLIAWGVFRVYKKLHQVTPSQVKGKQ